MAGVDRSGFDAGRRHCTNSDFGTATAYFGQYYQ
ncbi:hypothetical protein X011_02280 [Mycobacterium tuberculosis variant microti OV254]|nr:hypothetical protein X011_02280 [Mycobacterium tuberculosis variant microti OV254]